MYIHYMFKQLMDETVVGELTALNRLVSPMPPFRCPAMKRSTNPSLTPPKSVPLRYIVTGQERTRCT